jgi:hypothetical protein
MQKFQVFFKRTVALIEEYPLPLHRYFFLFGAILGVRLCLEFFANHRLFRIDDVIHIGLWFLFIIEAFMLQLHLFSKVEVERIVKLVVCCFSIALTAPLIDLLVSQGKFSKMNYLTFHTNADILWSYLTVGGASLSRGATIGIRIEIVLLVLASFNYLYIKTGSLFRTLLGTWSIYTVLFLSGAVPFFLTMINDALHLTYGPEDQSSVCLLFTIDLLLFLVLALRHNRRIVPFRLSYGLLFRIVSTFGLVIFGVFLARRNYPDNWHPDPTTIWHFPLLALVVLLLIAYENYARSEREKSAFLVGNVFLFLLVCTSACVSFHTCFATILAWGLIFFLYEQPLVFTRIPVLAQLIRAAQACACVFIGMMAFGSPMTGIGSTTLFAILSISFSIHLGYFYINRYIRT